MARSSVRLEPARYGVPGSDTRPSSPSSQLTPPIVYGPGRASGGGDRVGDEDRPVRRPSRAPSPSPSTGGRWCPSTIRLANSRVGGQQLPDHVRMPRQHLRAAVAQMRRQRRAGRRSRRRSARGVAAVCPIATRTPDATRCSMSGSAPADFGRERDEHDPAARGVLPAAEVVDARRRHVLARMRAARAVLGRQVRPLHVDAGDRRRRTPGRARAHSRRTARMTR